MSSRESVEMSKSIERMLVLSTAHITQQTSELLAADAMGELVVYPKNGYGFFVLVPTEESQTVSDCTEDLQACMALAKESGCQWLMLDRDAETIETLPTYDW